MLVIVVLLTVFVALTLLFVFQWTLRATSWATLVVLVVLIGGYVLFTTCRGTRWYPLVEARL